MASPIARAFVDIIARLQLDSNSELESGIRQGVRRAEADLTRLEGVAEDVAADITAALQGINTQIDIRRAINSLQRLGAAGEEALDQLRALDGRELSVDTAQFNRQISQLQGALTTLARDFNRLDGDTLELDVTKILRDTQSVGRRIETLVEQVDRLADLDPDIDFGGTLQSLNTLANRVEVLARRIEAFGDEEVRFRFQEIGLESLNRQLDEVQREIADLSGTRFNLNFEGGEAALRELRLEARRAGAELSLLENHGINVGRLFTSVGLRIAAFGAFRGAVNAMEQLVTLGVQATAEIERTTVALNQLFLGFAEAGRTLGTTTRGFIQDLRELAITTPFEFGDLGDISRRLVTLGGDADTVTGRMEDLADAAAAFGGTSDDINGVVRAITQLASKGKVDLQDFRQISERLPSFTRQLQIQGIIDELNELRPGLNATADDFAELREQGALTTDVIVNGLFRGLRQIPGAAGAAAAQARTLSGALSNLKDFATIQFADAFAGVGAVIADQLNAAFGSISEGGRTNLQAAIEDVISAAGDATAQALPSVLEFIEEISDEVADAIGLIGELIESLAEGFGADFAQGAIDGLRAVTQLLTLASDVLSVLPGDATRFVSQFVTLAAILPGVTVPFRNLAQDIGATLLPGLFKVREGVKDLGAALTTSLAASGAVTAGLAGLQIVLNRFADSARRTREFNQAIDDATDSLNAFIGVGSAALDFLTKFEREGEGVNVGSFWEDQLDGITTTEITDRLGFTRERLADLISELAQLEDIEPLSDDVNRTLREFGLALEVNSVGIIDNDSAMNEALISAIKLAEQFGEGSEAAFNAALEEDRFTFATEEATRAIVVATKFSGNYVKGLDDLATAHKAGAKAEFLRLIALEDLTAAQVTALLEQAELEDGTIDYAKATAQLQEDVENLDTTFQDLLVDMPDVGLAFAGITTEANIGRTALLSFAEVVDRSGLSVEQLDAIARQLGTTLTGQELGEKLSELVGQLTENIDAVTGALPGFGDAFQAALERFEIPEDIGEDVDTLQLQLDNFSTDAFIEELNKITAAQANLLFNLQGLANIDPEAVQRLLGLGLSPQQLAVAAEGLLAAGQAGVDAFLEPFQTSDELISGAGVNLARQLTEAGIDPALFEAIPGLTDSFMGMLVTSLEQVDVKTAVTAFNNEILREFSTFDPNSVLDEANIRRLTAARQRVLTPGAPGGGPTIHAPTIDVEPAVVQAQEASRRVSEAYVQEFDLDPGVQEELDTVVETISRQEFDFATSGADLARAAVEAFTIVFDLNPAVFREITDIINALSTDQLLPATARLTGDKLGDAFADGFVAALNAALPRLRQAVLDVLVDLARLQPPAPPGAGGLIPLQGFGFASGLIATQPTAGVFGERGPEALLPLSDGAAAARILAQLAPFIAQPGQSAALGLLGVGGSTEAGGGSVQQNSFTIVAPTDDPERIARKVASKLADEAGI